MDEINFDENMKRAKCLLICNFFRSNILSNYETVGR